VRLALHELMSTRRQPFFCHLTDGLLAEAAGVPLDRLHRDVEAICRAGDAGRPIAERLGLSAPLPHLAGFSYPHVTTLGCEVSWPEGSEPNVRPCIRRPEDIDELREPEDYLRCGVVPQRLATLAELRRRRPDAINYIGHPYEGPVTTAVLLMGSDFLLLAQDDPARVHRLLRFCVESAVHYARAISARLGHAIQPGPQWMPDDFAGLFSPAQFREFVAPYWDMLFTELEATERHVHSELLRVGHLPMLADLGVATFDPSADQYLTPELLRRHCPVPFTALIKDWEIRDHSAGELPALYRHIAGSEPVSISFTLARLCDEEKVRALLDVARELAA